MNDYWNDRYFLVIDRSDPATEKAFIYTDCERARAHGDYLEEHEEGHFDGQIARRDINELHLECGEIVFR